MVVGLVLPGAPHANYTLVAWAVFPDDGCEPSELMRVVDRRLHAEKDARYAHTYQLPPAADYRE